MMITMAIAWPVNEESFSTVQNRVLVASLAACGSLRRVAVLRGVADKVERSETLSRRRCRTDPARRPSAESYPLNP